jgi:hypothetical protein
MTRRVWHGVDMEMLHRSGKWRGLGLPGQGDQCQQTKPGNQRLRPMVETSPMPATGLHCLRSSRVWSEHPMLASVYGFHSSTSARQHQSTSGVGSKHRQSSLDASVHFLWPHPCVLLLCRGQDV